MDSLSLVLASRPVQREQGTLGAVNKTATAVRAALQVQSVENLLSKRDASLDGDRDAGDVARTRRPRGRRDASSGWVARGSSSLGLSRERENSRPQGSELSIRVRLTVPSVVRYSPRKSIIFYECSCIMRDFTHALT